MAYSRKPTANVEITRQPVSRWSEEEQRGCDARATLKMSKAECDLVFNRR
jgi:hypothetical protein